MSLYRDQHGSATGSVTDWSNTSIVLASGSNTITPPVNTMEIRITPSVAVYIKTSGTGASASDYPIGAGAEYVIPVAKWTGSNSFSVYSGGAGTLSIMYFG